MNKKKIKRFGGFCKVLSSGKVEVALHDGKKENLSAKHILVRPGPVPLYLPRFIRGGQNNTPSHHPIYVLKLPKKNIYHS
ncbi:hypothetical protein [Leptospira interrogans]|uniref:hypothetical protein n=1 Tax=Leptospira interrogans TaxID=173 RepID=UPI00188D3667|nr:hypothetical protein [Leptospira interrogans]MBF3368151.1 hypothetical protein [Leptospira interrogans serovar Pomona]